MELALWEGNDDSACENLCPGGGRGAGPRRPGPGRRPQADDRPAGRRLGAARRPAQGHVGKGGRRARRCSRCPAPASPTCAASRKARPTSASATRISTVDAVAGKPPFNKPHANVCNVATLYPQYFQVVVRADAGVNSVKDLKGKVDRRPAARQHRRGDHQAAAAGERDHLQRRQDELRVLYRCRHPGAGRARGRLHGRHDHPVRRRDGPRLGARRQDARPRRPARRDEEAQSRLHARTRSRRAPIRSRTRTSR